MKAVVTGCAGFIGSHLADHLLEQGHEVTGIDCLWPGRSDPERVSQAVDFHVADIRDDRIERHFAGADWVFHTAAVSTTPWAVKDPVTTNSVNVTGTLNLLEIARRARVSRFVFSSSNVVYAPYTAYWASKAAAEHYADVYTGLYGLPAVSLRYSNVFGSLRQNPENCIMSMRRSAREDGFIWLTGDGKQSRDFTDVRDICRANLLAAASDRTGIYDICTGENRTMNEIAALFGVPVEYRPEREGDVKHIRQDPYRARKELGFEVRIPFSESMKAYL